MMELGSHTQEHIEHPDDTDANAFYSDLMVALQDEPISAPIIMADASEATPSAMYTLRRLWLPSDTDRSEFPNLWGLTRKHNRRANVVDNIGLTLLRRWSIETIVDSKKSINPTEEIMEELAEELPHELTLNASHVAVFGPPKTASGRRYVGLGFDEESNTKVQKDQDAILRGLKAARVRKNVSAHMSFFSTKEQGVAQELAANLRSIIALPRPVLLGKAKPSRVFLKP
jgi:hypothetical protein